MTIPKLNIPAIQVSKNIDLSLKNFGQDNTPPKLQKAANLVLKLATLGVIVGTAMAAPPFSLPVGTQVVLYSGSIGTLFKTASKLFGLKVED